MDSNYTHLREEAIKKHGGKCAHCGFSDWRALQFDHVNSRGTSQRKLTGKSSFLKEILLDTSGEYQLLCANCNQIKRYSSKEGVSSRANERIVRVMGKFQEEEELVISLC